MRQGSYSLEVLEKISRVAFVEVKLLAENPRVGWKIGCFSKAKDLLIGKLGKISIRCLVCSQRLHCWLVAESFLVCQLKNGGVLTIDQIANQN